MVLVILFVNSPPSTLRVSQGLTGFWPSQYLVVSLSEYRFQTEAIQKTLNPEWNDIFDLPLSGANSCMLRCVCWDKDIFGKVWIYHTQNCWERRRDEAIKNPRFLTRGVQCRTTWES